jgi:hypothetical protein
MVCKELSGKFVWQHILHFDNGSYASQERSECITKQLLQHADELSRFESLFITCTADGTNLNALIQRLAPQLRRFRRDIYTIFITDEQTYYCKGSSLEYCSVWNLTGFNPFLWNNFSSPTASLTLRTSPSLKMIRITSTRSHLSGRCCRPLRPALDIFSILSCWQLASVANREVCNMIRNSKIVKVAMEYEQEYGTYARTASQLSLKYFRKAALTVLDWHGVESSNYKSFILESSGMRRLSINNRLNPKNTPTPICHVRERIVRLQMIHDHD